jgi:hypothetical protein
MTNNPEVPMTEREKGVETAACPTCGNELAVHDQLDGSKAAETCASCYPQKADPKTAEKASAVAVTPTPRETGTVVKEQ